MHFLVLGATGAIGSRFCKLALGEGHKLTLFVRSRNKIPSGITNHDAVVIIEGKLEGEDALERASHCGAEIFVSFAGPPRGTQGTVSLTLQNGEFYQGFLYTAVANSILKPLANGYKSLVPKLAAQGCRRVLILGTPSFHGDTDSMSWKWRLGTWTIKYLSPGQYREVMAIGEYVSSLPVDDGIQWTLFRVGGLTMGEEAPVNATHLGSGMDATWISRASVARWVLDEAVQPRWTGKMPFICNP